MTEGCPMPTSPVLCAMAIFLRLHLLAASLQISCMAGLRTGSHLALPLRPWQCRFQHGSHSVHSPLIRSSLLRPKWQVRLHAYSPPSF